MTTERPLGSYSYVCLNLGALGCGATRAFLRNRRQSVRRG
jgi:hypothetical protein